MTQGKGDGDESTIAVAHKVKGVEFQVLYEVNQVIGHLRMGISGWGHAALAMPAQIISSHTILMSQRKHNAGVPESETRS
jgi:hypothetical protein